MGDQAKPVERQWRRFVRFRVRGLVVFVLLVGSFLGWLRWLVRSARIQRQAVAAIETAGGVCRYDWEPSFLGYSSGRQPRMSPSPGHKVGSEYFGHIASVSLLSSAPDLPMVQIGRLAGVQELHVNGGVFGSVPIDDELVHLRGLTSLSQLDLEASRVTDAGLVHLERLTNLTHLHLGGTRVTDAGLVQVSGLTNLLLLDLGSTGVTDSGLRHLRPLVNLSVLTLAHTGITDAGLAQLKGLSNLTRLELRGTRATAAGVKELHRALPNLWIIR